MLKKKKIIAFWRLKSTVGLPQHRKINLLNRMHQGAESHVWWNVPFTGRCEYDTRFRMKRVSHNKVWLKFSLHVWVWNVKVKRLLRLFEGSMWTCAHTWCLERIYSNSVRGLDSSLFFFSSVHLFWRWVKIKEMVLQLGDIHIDEVIKSWGALWALISAGAKKASLSVEGWRFLQMCWARFSFLSRFVACFMAN